ncbi:hypothetical protein Tco_1383558 [Tanacetum coccineum]
MCVEEGKEKERKDKGRVKDRGKKRMKGKGKKKNEEVKRRGKKEEGGIREEERRLGRRRRKCEGEGGMKKEEEVKKGRRGRWGEGRRRKREGGREKKGRRSKREKEEERQIGKKAKERRRKGNRKKRGQRKGSIEEGEVRRKGENKKGKKRKKWKKLKGRKEERRRIGGRRSKEKERREKHERKGKGRKEKKGQSRKGSKKKKKEEEGAKVKKERRKRKEGRGRKEGKERRRGKREEVEGKGSLRKKKKVKEVREEGKEGREKRRKREGSKRSRRKGREGKKEGRRGKERSLKRIKKEVTEKELRWEGKKEVRKKKTKEGLRRKEKKKKEGEGRSLISLLTTISLSSTMAVLDSCPKHNMVSYLEKSEGNAEFHEIINFLKRSSIHHALTVSPVVSTTFVEQFWMSAKSKPINNVRNITAKVAGKSVSISKASIRSDLLFDDADGIDSLPNQAIFDAIQLMGYEGDLTVLTFNKALFSPQWRFLFHTINHCLSSKSTSWDQIPTNIATAVICLTSNQKYNFSKLIFDGMLRHLDAKKKFVMYPRFISIFLDKQLANVSVPLDHFPVNTLTSKVFSFMVKKGKHFSGKVTPLFATMLVQPTQDEGASSERPSEAQPTPSPAPTSEVPYEPQTDSSPAQTSEVPLEHMLTLCEVPLAQLDLTHPQDLTHYYFSCFYPETSGEEPWNQLHPVSDQTKEIQDLKAKITKLKKQAKPVIKHHKAYLKVSSLKQRFLERAFSKKHRVTQSLIPVDHMETENAQSEGRTREMVDEDKEIDERILSTEDVLSTDKEGVSTDFEKVSTDRPIVSTDGSKVSTDKQIEGTEEPNEGTDENLEGTKEQNEDTVEIFEGTEEQREGTREKLKVLDGQIKAKAVSKEKEKGVELKDVEETDRPRPTSTRSLLTLKPLPKIDPKDKGKKKIEEEDESESESDGIPQAEKKFKQLESDEELARKVQAEWEEEEERNRGEVVYTTLWFMKYSAYVKRIVADFSHTPPNEYSLSTNDKMQWSLVWGEVNPVHAYYNGSCTSKDNEDPSWSTSFKTRRTQKTSLALEVLWKTLFMLYLYLIGTLHDIQFSTVLCARYQSNLKESHLIALKRILRYLKGTPTLGLYYPKCSGFDLKGYSDSDYAGCNMDRKSTSGACQILGGKLVCWSAKKQQSLAMSSAEAEYVVAAGCCASILWMKSQFSDYDIHYKMVPIFYDNTSAIAISNNPVLHSRTKHIDIRYHFIRDHILKGDIELHFIPIEYQLADIFTKPLDEPTFTRLKVELGMLNID